jgi:tetratricopeptide (TPR) repeat protein
VGHRAGEGRAYGNLGCAYEAQGDLSKAIEYHKEHLSIAKEVGDRAGEGVAYGTSATRMICLGTIPRRSNTTRRTWRLQRKCATGQGRAMRTNLGIAYQSLADCSKAIEYYAQRLAIAKELGDRAGEGRAYNNLGTCHLYLNALSCAGTAEQTGRLRRPFVSPSR